MNRKNWNKAYADRLQEVWGMDQSWAMGFAEVADDSFNNGDNPADAADEEMSYWDADE